MTVGNLTYAIVIRTELHGEDYQFTGGGERLRVGRCSEWAVNQPTQLHLNVFSLFKKTQGRHLVCVCSGASLEVAGNVCRRALDVPQLGHKLLHCEKILTIRCFKSKCRKSVCKCKLNQYFHKNLHVLLTKQGFH